NVPLGFWVRIAVDDLEGRPQFICQSNVQESVHNAMVLLLGNLRNALAAERLVALVPGHIDLDEVPAPAKAHLPLRQPHAIGVGASRLYRLDAELLTNRR